MKNKLLIVVLIYSSSFALASCSKTDPLMQLNIDAKKIQDKIEENEEITNETLDIMLKSGAHNRCFSCDYTWNKETDPNIY